MATERTWSFISSSKLPGAVLVGVGLFTGSLHFVPGAGLCFCKGLALRVHKGLAL